MATVQQLDKDKPRARCRSWRLWANSGAKRRSRRFHGTYTEAVAAAAAFEAEAAQEDARASSALFLDYAALWHERRAASLE